MCEGGQLGRVGDGEESGCDGLPAEFVQVEGDGLGAFQAGELVAVAVAEQEGAAVGGVHVEFGVVGGAQLGDGGQRVDGAGVGGTGGGDDQEGLVVAGEGGVECGEVDGRRRGRG